MTEEKPVAEFLGALYPTWRQQWEYLNVIGQRPSRSELNQFGADGWELVTAVPHDHERSWVFVFKPPLLKTYSHGSLGGIDPYDHPSCAFPPPFLRDAILFTENLDPNDHGVPQT